MRAASIALSLLVGCASAPPPPPPSSPLGSPPKSVVPPAPREPTADEVLDTAIATYAKLATYADTGEVTTEYVGKPDAERAPFSTTFSRATGWLAFAFTGKTATTKIWLDARDPHTPHAILAIGDKPPEDYGAQADAPLDGAAGVTRITSMFVPLMLRGGRALLDAIDDPALASPAREPIDGHACFHVTGTGGSGRVLDVWIDADSHLVRKLVDHSHLARAGIDVVETIAISPDATPPPAAAMQLPAFPTAPIVVAAPSWVGVRLEKDARVKAVIPSSPAAAAGFAAGDHIVSVDGAPTPDANEATVRLHNAKVGVPIAVVIERAGAQQTIRVAPQTMPDPLGLLRGALVGKPGPDLAAGMRGHVVVLDFWATWCKPCLSTMPRLDRLAQKYAARGLHVVGYTDESVAQIAEFRGKHAITYPLQQDANNEIATHYLVQGIPQLVVIDKQGIVRSVDVGAGNLRDVERLVKSLL